MADYDQLAQAEANPLVEQIPKPQPAVQADPYEALAAQDATTAYDSMRQSLGVALKQDPDSVAQRKALADKAGVPLPVVERNAEIVQMQQRAREIQAAAAVSPILRRQLSDPQFAALAHDSAENLSAVESAVRHLTGGPRALAAGILTNFNAAAWALSEAGAKAVGAEGAGETFRRYRKEQEALGARIQGDYGRAGLGEAGVASGFRSFGALVPGTLASVMTGNPAFMLGAGGLQAGGQATGKGLDEGLSAARALLYGAQDATAEIATEMIPVARLFKDLRAGTPFLKLLGRQIATEVPTELAATAWQNFNEWANLHPEQSFDDYLAQLGPDQAQTVIATVTQTILSAGLAKGAARLSQRYEADQRRATEASQDAQVLQQLNALAAASKLRERDPKSFEQFVAAATENGQVQEVYLDPQVLAQAGVDLQALAQASPAVAAQLQEAMATGADLVIPVGEYAARVAGTDLDAVLTPHLRTAEDAMSIDEAQRFYQGQAESMRQAAEQVTLERAADTEWQASAKQVEDTLMREFQTAGRFTDDVNRAYTGLLRDFYVTTAQRLDLTPAEMFQRYPLRVRAESVAGEQRMSQITPEQAMRTNVPLDLPADPLFAEAVGNTPGAQVTENGLLIDLVRFQKPEQEGAQAIRTGVMYLPAKSKNIRHYRVLPTTKTPNAYGGSEKMEGVTLIRRPLFIKGATGGKAPEAAYAAIKGKDAVKKLDSAVMDVVTSQGFMKRIDADSFLMKVEQFLGDYGGERGLAREIIENSKKGNTLRYALQEHIVASTVRAAGYDAVVGYSTGKAGASISEVFDVREQTYPARGMESQVHESFDQPPQTMFQRAVGAARTLLAGAPKEANQTKQQLVDRGLLRPVGKTAKGVKVYRAVAEGEDTAGPRAAGSWVTPNRDIAVNVYARGDETRVVEDYMPERDLYEAHPDGWVYAPSGTDVTGIVRAPGITFGDMLRGEGMQALDMGQFFQGAQERDLVIQHSLTSENLLNAAKVGGLPVPSLAITRGANAVTSFGDITLLGDAGMATPGGDTKVFGSDIYSPRYPRIEYKLGAPALKALNAKLQPFLEDGRELYGNDVKEVDDLTGNKAFQRFAADHLGVGNANTLGYHDMKAVASAMLAEIGAEERIFQGFTYSGNRRYIPHTLDNVVKILKKELRGGEGFNYGVGSVRAHHTPQFRSLNAIRKEKNRLVTREKFEQIKKEVDDEFFRVADGLSSFHPSSKSFGYADAVALMMSDSAKMGVPRALQENGFQNVPSEVMEEVRDYLNKLRNLPTEYFEAKITRAVRLDEFAAAVVPDDVDPKARAEMEKAGLHIYEYKHGDDAARRAAVDNAAEERGLYFQPASPEGNRAEISFARDITTVPSVITLFKTADLSSFLHEMGHFQLEVLAHIASQPGAPQAVVDDFNAALKWFGITGSEAAVDPVAILQRRTPGRVYMPEELTQIDTAVKAAESPRNAAKALVSGSLADVDAQALAQAISDLRAAAEARTPLEVWQAMSLEEKRPYHEQFARGFEAYLFEGKAPSAELDNLFARFRAWLLNVYKSIQALNVEINDEIRGVFDRLLATQDAIEQAEAARSYAPLFTEAPGGMNPAEWAQYQDLASEATADAIANLQRRSLRDMQWLGNARGRILKQLQADAKDKRKAVEAEVRAEVRATPVYAAMRFLKRGEMVTEEGEQIQAAKGHKLDNAALAEMYPETMLARPDLDGLRGMTRNEGLHPDLVAEMFGFTSGDQLVREMLDAQPEAQVIEGVTDQRVLERYGDLANPDTIARAVDEAIHNEARARFVATELKALTASAGPVRVMTKAAKDFAAAMIARKKVREIKPNQHAAAETRAAKAAQTALAAGDTLKASQEKRNQLVQNYATRAAYDALDEVDKALRYMRKFNNEGTRKNLDAEYLDQIDQLLERFDLRASVTNKDAAKRASLLSWVELQRERGFEPDIPQDLITEAQRKPYREMTLGEMRGLADSVKQIEHLGRLKKKLLTAKDEREFQAIRDEIAASIEANAKGVRELRTRNTTGAMLADAGNRFLAMHRKMASVAREMDGFADGGPVWEYLIRSMNEAGNRETTMRAEATAKLYALVKPLTKAGAMGGKGQFFATLGGSFNREERIAIALNLGNASNTQRLLGGEGWTMEQLQPLLDTITPQEAQFVQAVWDFFEAYRPEIAVKETRIYGKEPEWVEPVPITLGGQQLRGGYYPIKYDINRSGRAEQHAEAEAAKQQMRGAYTTATTRRSFTKTRAEEVTGRPLLYTFSGIYQGTNEVIHDLSWHEWLIDSNRLVRSLDGPIRTHYGPETVTLFKKAIEDIAAGDVPAQNVFEKGVNHLRMGATVAGLGWNFSTALLQPFGLTQSMARIGPGWVAKGLSQWIKAPLATGEEVREKSAFMHDRARTMQREINEIQNQIRGSKLDPVRATFFLFIQKMQMVADMPTWLGAYEKAIAAGNAEDRAVALADQAVLDAQGGGQIKDLAQIQRGGPLLKLWTNFYSFFNTTYNLAVEKTKQKGGDPRLYPGLAMDYLLLFVVPSVMVTLLKAALQGDTDDEDELAKKIVADQISYMLGTMVGLREISAAVQKVAGVEQFKGSYGGPAGLRMLQEIDKLSKQVAQGDVDAALLKALNNTAGNIFHYPSGQINRTVEGAAAMIGGRTENPMVLLMGPPRP